MPDSAESFSTLEAANAQDRLARLRSACLATLEELSEDQALAQPHPELSPLA